MDLDPIDQKLLQTVVLKEPHPFLIIQLNHFLWITGLFWCSSNYMDYHRFQRK